LVVLGVGLVAPPAAAGAPDGSSGGPQDQALLERPGLALQAALQAARQGDRLRADGLLAEIALQHPVIADYALRMRAEWLLAWSRPAEAVAAVDIALASDPTTPLRPDLLALQGQALAQQGNEAAARKVWRAALDSTRKESLRASLLLATAQSQERTGEMNSAIETYRLLWHLYPLSPEASQAGARLEQLAAELGELLRSAVDWRRRADALYRGRRNPEALEAYERALAMGLSKSQTNRARRSRAQTLFRMRAYPRAVDAFASLRQADDIPLWYARSLARADRVPEAIRAFERMASERGHSRALRARFLAALLLEGRGKSEQARAHLSSLTQGSATSSMRRASLWRLAWGAYREQRYAEAIGLLDGLLAEDRDPIGRLRARYWRARALESMGQEPAGDLAARPAAQIQFESLALEYPLSYYGWRARTRLSDSEPLLVRPPDEVEALAPGRLRLTSSQLARGRILLEAGFREEAVEELAGLSKRVGGLQDRLELAQLFRDAGDFRRAQRTVVDPYKLALARAPTPRLEELWWHAWPVAYREFVEAETSRPGSVEAALVFSIMREESGFRPEVVSPVGARGLLQIMEPTGERLARAVGHANFEPDDLFEPRINIRLGAHYLAELTERFDGRLSAVIASYNAGPEAVAGWLEERPDLADDEWVEAIPYEQTRTYVKRVLRSLQAYRLLY
jgi:soluble lytic murein transglycosylase